MPAYTSDSLLRAVRRLAFLPDACDLTDSDLLELADEEMLTIISERVKAAREEHWVVREDITLTGAMEYQIPRRAVGRMVRGISLVNGGVTFPCPQIDPVLGWAGASTSGTTAYCYYFAGDKVCFPATPPLGWTLRVWYLRRPSRLVLTADARAIDSAPTTLSIEVVSPPPVAWQTAGTLLDIVRGDVPFDLTYVDRRVDSYFANVFTLESDTPIDPSEVSSVVGNPNGRQDWLCLRDETVYPQIPAELIPVLEASVARRALEAIGDRQGVTVVSDTLERRKRAAVDIIEPRNEQGSRPIFNRFSALRGAGGGFRRGRRW